MKKIFLSMTMLLIVATTTVWAANTEPPVVIKQAEAAFQNEFAGAEFVTWTEAGDLLKAGFLFRGHRVEAYFNREGELQASIRSLIYSQLPLAVITSLDKHFAGNDVLDILEINKDGTANYKLNIEVKDKKYQVRINASGHIIEKQRVRS
jgi:hypothetical protein